MLQLEEKSLHENLSTLLVRVPRLMFQITTDSSLEDSIILR